MNNNVYLIGLMLVILFTIIVVGCSNGGETKGSSDTKLTKKNSDELFDVLTDVKNISQENNVSLPNNDIENNVRINGGKTLDEAMDYYMSNIKSSKGSSGAFFTGKYKIIDTEETTDMVNVYAYVVSRWVDTSGNTVSGGSGVLRIGFKKDNNLYIYIDYEQYKAVVTPYVPQTVSEIVSNDGRKIYNDLIEEIEKDIENFINPNI